MSLNKSFVVSAKNEELIALLIAKGANADISETSTGEKISALLIADAFRSIEEDTIVSFKSVEEQEGVSSKL